MSITCSLGWASDVVNIPSLNRMWRHQIKPLRVCHSVWSTSKFVSHSAWEYAMWFLIHFPTAALFCSGYEGLGFPVGDTGVSRWWFVILMPCGAMWTSVKLKACLHIPFLFPGKMTCWNILGSWHSSSLSQLNEKWWSAHWYLPGFQHNEPSPFLQIFTWSKCWAWLSEAQRLTGDLTRIVSSSFFFSETSGDLPGPACDMFLQVEGETSPHPALPQWVAIVIIVMVMKMMIWQVKDGVGLYYQWMGVSLLYIFNALTLLIAGSIYISGV